MKDNIQEVCHDLKNNIHNIFSLLEFIRDDKILENSPLYEVLHTCLKRKEKLLENLSTLTIQATKDL